MSRNNLTVLGTALVILGTALVISVTALSNVSAGTQTPGEDTPVITEADLWDVVSAEIGLWAGDDVESMFPEHIVAAAKKRYDFQESGEYIDGAWWQDLIGEDTFGDISLGLDGTVTIKYVGKEPDLSILPAQFEYKFVPTDKTLKEAAEVDEYVDNGYYIDPTL